MVMVATHDKTEPPALILLPHTLAREEHNNFVLLSVCVWGEGGWRGNITPLHECPSSKHDNHKNRLVLSLRITHHKAHKSGDYDLSLSF